MVLRDKLVLIRQSFFDKTREMAIEFATKFGYPENKGMPLVPERLGSDGKPYLGFRVYDNDILSRRDISYYPPQTADNFLELIIGKFPHIQPLQKFVIESSADGPYGFSIENYKNLFFLPNPVSEFIQIHLNFCVDISFLEAFREVLFLSIVAFAEIVSIRILVSWLLTINPYTFPWNYFVALVDWTEETLIGLVPSIIGVNLSGPILITILGKCADSLNNLVFTMPYLPSEGEPSQIVINDKLRDVLSFKHLPILWYEHPIPNELRTYWYNERPDIIVYMQEAYKGLNIQFLPDGVTEDLFQDSLLDFLFDKPLPNDINPGSLDSQDLPNDINPGSLDSQDLPNDISHDSLDSQDLPNDISHDSLDSQDLPNDISHDSLDSQDLPNDINPGSLNSQELVDHISSALKESKNIINPTPEQWEKDHITVMLTPDLSCDNLISNSYYMGILPDKITLYDNISEQNILVSKSIFDLKEITHINYFRNIVNQIPVELVESFKLEEKNQEVINTVAFSDFFTNPDLISMNYYFKSDHIISLSDFVNNFNHLSQKILHFFN
jgi:hypothetical protein